MTPPDPHDRAALVDVSVGCRIAADRLRRAGLVLGDDYADLIGKLERAAGDADERLGRGSDDDCGF